MTAKAGKKIEEEVVDPNYAGEGIYRENIMDHFKHPRNHGRLPDADITHKEFNPVCGDQIEMGLKFNNGNVQSVRFSGHGCAISQSSASMLTEAVEGKPVSEVKKLTRDDIVDMLSIPLTPIRLKCALLGLDTLRNAIHMYEKYGGKHG